MNTTSKVGLLAGMMVLTVLAISGNATALATTATCGSVGETIDCLGGNSTAWTASMLEAAGAHVRNAGCWAFQTCD